MVCESIDILYVNQSTVKIHGPLAVIEWVREELSVPNPAYNFRHKMPDHVARFVKQRLYLLTPAGCFNINLLYIVYNFLKSNFNNVKIDQQINDDLASRRLLLKDHILTLQPRKDQIKAYKQLIHSGNGICIMGTGGGKTLIIAKLISNLHALGKRVLLLVPDVGLVNQMQHDLKEYNVPFTPLICTGKHKSNDEEIINAPVVIANSQFILSKNNKSKKIWKEFDAVVIDEVHGIKSKNNITNFVNKINTPHKFGFTGTLPEDKYEKWKIIEAIGPVVYKKDASDLRDDGSIAPVIANIHVINYANQKIHAWQQAMDFLSGNEYRNNKIKDIINNNNKNVLVLVNRLEHANDLKQFLANNTKMEVFMITGEMPVEQRREIQNHIESNDNICCIAITKIFSTGINIKNIHRILLASGGKSYISVVQSIGRGARLHKNKSNLEIIDIFDNIGYFKDHGLKRAAIYKKENIPTNIIKD